MDHKNTVVPMWQLPTEEPPQEVYSPAPQDLAQAPYNPAEEHVYDAPIIPAQPFSFNAYKLTALGFALLACLLAYFAAASAWPKILPSLIGASSVIRFVSQLSAPLALLTILWLMIRQPLGLRQSSLQAHYDHLERTQNNLQDLMHQSELRFLQNTQSLTEQAQQLDAIAEVTVSRIATLRAMLGEEIGQIGLHAHNLKNAAAGARSDMAVLMANLPNAHNETRSLARTLQQTGQMAHDNIHMMNIHMGNLTQHSANITHESQLTTNAVSQQVTMLDNHISHLNHLLNEATAAFNSAGDVPVSALEQRITGAGQNILTLHEALHAYDGIGARLFERTQAALADIEAQLNAINAQNSAALDQNYSKLEYLRTRASELNAALVNLPAQGRTNL